MGVATSPSTGADESAGFHQSWFPLALSTALDSGRVLGRDFLGSRVVLYREPAGKALVQSGYCPHLGADLSVGQVIDGQLRCAYHHWSFGPDGRCVHIPTGDKIPPGAKIATYPSAEAWGLVWAFNGERPLFGVPRMPDATEADLAFETYLRGSRPWEPWLGISNGVDFQHLRALHGLPGAMVPEALAVGDYDIEYRVDAPGYSQHGVITGTNTFAQHLSVGGAEMFMMFSSAAVDHGKGMGYYVIGVPKRAADGAAARQEAEAKLAALKQFVDKLNDEDAPVLSSIRFRKGVLVASDRHLARFLKYVSEFPRALPLGE